MRINRQSVEAWICTGFLLLTTSFFFLDPTLYIPKAVVLPVSWLLVSWLVIRGRLRFPPVFLAAFAFLVILQFAKLNGAERYDWVGASYVPGVVQLVFLACLLGRRPQVALKSLDRYITIFVLLCLPSIFFLLAMVLGWDLPYKLIHLGGRDLFYRNYYNLAIFGEYEVLHLPGITISRLCGVFEEAGMLGTFVGVLQIVDVVAFPARRTWRKAAMFVLGLLSFSLAYYIFFFAIVGYTLWKLGRAPRLALALVPAGMVLALVLFPGFRAAFDYLIVSRFEVADQGVLAGNTTYIEYAERYAGYLRKASALDLAFGHGSRSSQLDSQAQYGAYQGVVYESGYVGLLLVLLFAAYFLVWLPLCHRYYLLAALTSVALLSFYHRPQAFDSPYLVLYAALYLRFAVAGDSAEWGEERGAQPSPAQGGLLPQRP